MENNSTENKQNQKITDYLSILLKWKKLLFVSFLIITLISIGISFLIPTTYKCTATIMMAPDNNIGFGALAGALNKNSALSLGAKLLGTGSEVLDQDLVLGIMNSRSVMKNVINKFNLDEYYDIDKSNTDRIIKSFKSDFSFDPNEFGLIEISVIHEDPQIGSNIANYFVKVADSIHIKIKTSNSKRTREFIEKRYQQNLADLKLAEEKYQEFQTKYGAFDIPSQIKVAVQAEGELESEIAQNEILLQTMKNNLNEDLSIYKSIENKIKGMKAAKTKIFSNSNNDNIIIAKNLLPELQKEYIRLYREMEIQNLILKFVYPMYEQARIDENKSIPTIDIIDKAVPPTLKYAPKRAIIVGGITSFILFIIVILIFRIESLINTKTVNVFEQNEKEIYKWLKEKMKI